MLSALNFQNSGPQNTCNLRQVRHWVTNKLFKCSAFFAVGRTREAMASLLFRHWHEMLCNLIMWHLSLCDDLEHPGQALRFPQRSVGCFLPETELVAHWAVRQWESIPVKVRLNSFPSGHLGTWKKMKFSCSAPSHHWKYLNTSRGGSRCQVFPAQKGLNDHLLSQLGVPAEGVLN